MSLPSRQQAADLMDVPVAWVSAMLEIRALNGQEDVNHEIMIDADEIIAKGYIAPRIEASSFSHVLAMLDKLGIGRRDGLSSIHSG